MTPPSSDAKPEIRVTYPCSHSSSLTEQYAAQVSSGITFVQTNNGPRALGEMREFYLAPMEQADISGMAFFIFEAQRQGDARQATAKRNFPGGRADFFWAIGGQSPFPFVKDSGRNKAPLLHIAYAAPSTAQDNKPDFMHLLHGVHLK